MRNFHDALLDSKLYFRFLMAVAVLGTLAALTPSSTATPSSVTINVVNNSGREIRRLYLSPANNDNWGADQLNGSAISSGSTRTLNLSWDQATVKLVAEDQDGCFMSTTVAASGSHDWTITGDTSRDCGD